MLHSKLKSFIEKKDGTFLVIGAPGTGKTHVLLEMISFLLKEKNIPPDRILVFSFNRRWAKILREKTSEGIEESLMEIPITSFFAYCAELIEKNLLLKDPENNIALAKASGKSEYFKNAVSGSPDEEAKYSNLKILTAPEQWKLLKDVISGRLDKKNYPHTFRFMESSPHIYRSYIQEVFDFILRAQENLLAPRLLSNKFTPFYNQVLSEIVGIYINYLECLRSSGLYNYGRLLVDAAEVLQNDKGFAGFCKKSYEFIIVDEFQEINRAQFEIVKSISNNNVILFGNDDECTYAFRGSMLNNFNSVYKDLASGSGKSGNILFLENNLRSNYLINEVCRKFIETNEDRINKKSLVRIPAAAKEGTFETCEFKTVMDEINFICSSIKKLIFLKNIKPEKICIIVKGMGYKARLLENILSGSNIPFMRRSSRTILENHFIKYILNFLKFIVLQSSSNENSMQIETQLIEALLCSEPIGLRPIFVKKIFSRTWPEISPGLKDGEIVKNKNTAGYKSAIEKESSNPDCSEPARANSRDNPLGLNSAERESAGPNAEGNTSKTGSLLENIREFLKSNYAFLKTDNQKKSVKTGKSAILYDSLYSKDLARLSDFTGALEKYIQLNLGGASAETIIDKLVNDEEIGVLKHLLGRNINPDYMTINTLSLLGDYLRTVNDFSESNPMSNSAEKYLIFLEDIISNNFLEEIEESTKEFIKPGFINILSYHQCKGLEFDAVFLPFINENYLPSPFGRAQLYDMQIFNYFIEGKSYAEEILRRKHLADERKLFYTGLSRAKDHAFVTSSSTEPGSRFFEELKEIIANVKKIIPVKNIKSIKKANKNKTGGNLKSEPGTLKYLEYKNQRLASLEKWLIRKRAISKIYKRNNKMAADRDTLIEDLIFLKEMYPPQSWWSIKKLSLNNNVPSRVINPEFSYSSLSCYLECPVKYKMNYFFKLKQEKNLNLLIGSIYHEIVKNYFENNIVQLSWTNLEKEIRHAFSLKKFKLFEFAYLKKEIIEKAVEDFKNYYEGYINGNVLNVSSERAFDFDVEGSRVKGRIDQINFISEDFVELIDFKSGKKNSVSLNEENEIQLRLYRMAIDLSPGLIDLKGKEYSMKYIFLGDKKNQEIRLDNWSYDLGQFYYFIKNTIDEIKKEKFDSGPKNTFTCKDCQYRSICSFRP